MDQYLAALVLLCSFSALAEKAPAIPDYPLNKIGPNSFIIQGPMGRPNEKNQGFMNNPGVILTSAGVVVIDPGASVQAGEMVLRQIRTITELPVVAVFNTHIHGDHWLGNQAIQAAYPKIKIYAHPNMLEEVAQGEGERWRSLLLTMTNGATQGTVVVEPNATKDHGETLLIGDTLFRFHFEPKAHSNTDLMIEIPSENLLFLGDNALNGRFGQMTHATFKGNIASLERAINIQVKQFVPGHGAVSDRSMVINYMNYLKLLRREVSAMQDQDLEDFEMKPLLLKKLSAYTEWGGFNDEFGRHISLVYLELESEKF